VRPLVRSADTRDTRKMARDYEIEIARSGLISILGGKWTVYRAMAEDAVDAVQRSVTGRVTACATRTHSLFGSLSESEDGHAGEVDLLAEAHGITRETARHLVRKLGRALWQVCLDATWDGVQPAPGMRSTAIPSASAARWKRSEWMAFARKR
jgi:glycerol-3-phosphate dehydrogenase